MQSSRGLQLKLSGGGEGGTHTNAHLAFGTFDSASSSSSVTFVPAATRFRSSLIAMA